MIDPRIYPQGAIGDVKKLGDVGTSATFSFSKMITEINFGNAAAATVTADNKPLPGMILTITQSGSGTAAHKFILPAGCTFDGTNRAVTCDAAGERLTAIAVTSTQFVILYNNGTLAAS